jgi:hypothetical protein
MKAVIIIIAGVLPLLGSVRIGRTRPAFLRKGVAPRSGDLTPMRRPLALGMNPVDSLVVASRFGIKGAKTMRRDVEAGRTRVISRGPHVIPRRTALITRRRAFIPRGPVLINGGSGVITR